MSPCSHSKQEQLYMLDLYIDTITFFPNKLQEIVKTPGFYIGLKLSDIPEFLIQQKQFNKRSNQIIPKDGILKLSAGKIHIFTKKPSDLLRIIKSEPLILTVHQIIEKPDCGEETVENPPICTSKIILPGCQCDQIAMASNQKKLPKSYILTNTYNLVDRDKPAGRIFLSLRIAPLGRSVSLEFLNCDGSFLFKNSGSVNEFRCFRIPESIEEVTKKMEYFQDKSCFPEEVVLPDINPAAKPENAVGLKLVCEQLAKKDGGPAEILIERKIPVTVVPKEEEKKIDSIPRTIYCICEENGNFLKRLTENRTCGGIGCKGGLCLGSRTLEPFPRDFHGGDRSKPCYTGVCCSGSSWGKKESPAGDCRIMRLRGGGGCGCGMDEGGVGCFPPIGRLTCGSPEEKDLRIKTLFSGLGKKHSSTTTEFTRKRGCGCFDNEDSSCGTKFCSKRPCLGADCLIRAFKETQEFVDSIGRVPGMAGLGLMDPSESPYFGRKRPANYCPLRKPESQAAENTSAPEPSKQMRPSLQPKSPTLLMALSDLPLNLVVPKDTAVTQSSSIPPSKPKKKEERVDKQKDQVPVLPVANEEERGPCNLPTCTSRRRKLSAKGPEAKPIETSVAPGTNRSKQSFPMGGFFSRGSKEQRKKLMRSAYGDHRRASSHKDSVKVPRRIGEHVRMISRKLPGICYGHRNCLDLRMRVPRNMGWLWNSRSLLGKFRPRLGWRPGAISKYVYELLMEAKAFDKETSIETRASTSKGRSSTKIRSSASITRGQRSKSKDPRDREVELPPTLHIHRKDGVYYVTMYPIRKGIEDNPALQETVKPIQFKITKNKDDASEYSSSTASDMEIEFSPPAALTKYRKKPEPIHKETQVTQQGILDATKPIGPKPAGSKKKKRKH